ncbi:class I SAM-dependent methyltransferase [Hymenobacter latericus]|uniref:class I SAM-dependent methyltransferase n=1 Tax=Hymenobacter sp. YIM 151858-1 TaxID=2987688 RepID=UPI0022273B4C|nr:class I SAM-dependent methyltransferase [Hymenobacter sp. YIM 151858-1]UYZ57916.1 class I SAM-dependent methyltransferase [Hymenobacter sp. YIM 151858-1]
MFAIRLLSLGALLMLLSAASLLAQQRPATASPRLEQERQRWNRSLTRDTAYKFNRQPNALLMEVAKGRQPGKALDVGMGQGRNTLFLARQGWDVTGVDIADEAVAEARAQARRENLRINAVVSPMETFDYGTNRYDLVAFVYEGCFETHPEVLASIKQALKPGGVLVFEFFHREAGVEMNRPDFGCLSGAVQALFANDARFKMLRYEEKMGIPDFRSGSNKYHRPLKLVYCVVQKQ